MKRAFPIDPRDVAVRFTHLKAMGKSPLHMLEAVNHGRIDSSAMQLGRLIHWQVLGGMPDDEDGEIAIYEGERRGNAWKDFEALHPNDEIVTRKEYDRATAICESVKNDPIAAPYLVGIRETQIKWKIGGRDCTSRPDVLNPATSALVDLKSTGDASLVGLKRQAWKMCYHAQLAFYTDAAKFSGVDVRDAYIVGVETRAPYAVTVLRLTERTLEEGRRMYRSWFEQMLVCEQSEFWPAYTQHVEQFDVPDWMAPDDDGDAEEEAA